MLIACNHGNTILSKEIVEIKISPNESNQVNILQLIESIDLIPLETNDNSLIGNIRTVKADENYLYVLDYSNSPVKMFSKDGKFISEIGRKGAGPGEYIQISDFLPGKDTVNIFAWSGNRKWIRYSSANKFLYETNMSFPFDVICPLNSDKYLLYVSNGTVSDECDHYLYCIDRNFKIQSRLDPKISPTDIPLNIAQAHFCQNSEYILYMKNYCDTVYTVSRDLDIQAKYHFDFGKNWFSESFLKEYHDKTPLQIYDAVNQREYVKFIHFCENKENLIVGYCIQHDKTDCYYISIYFKNTGKVFNFKSASTDLLVNLIVHPHCVDGNQFVSLISADELLEIASKNDNNDFVAEKIKKCAKQIDEFSNPVLVRYNFKPILSECKAPV
jgi:hypothetical protein